MQVPLFKRCYPNSNQFADLIKIKSVDDWKVEYVQLDNEIGYWISDSPFYNDGFDLYRNLVSTFPIVKDTNLEGCSDANPFATIHLPEWCCLDIFILMKSYFSKRFPVYLNMNFSEWGNLYFKDEAKPYDYFRLPHCDGPNGIVSNLWFSDHPVDECGTVLYRYHGNVIKGPDNKLYFDYQFDKDHRLFNECRDLSLSKKRFDKWIPLTIEEETYWGFERVGVAPSRQGSMTIYNTEIAHSPYVGPTCEFRWSHAYSITFEPLL
jgi:hypothetical protein